jgi:PST family polysaccharide transporter/lipopolysaccharide exporter
MRLREKLRAAVSQITPAGGTTERVVKSGIWLMGQNVAGRVLQLLMLVVLARLIGPREMGLTGIALLGLSAMKKFTNIGLNSALIQQKEENVDEYLNTTWLLEIGRGLLIASVLFAAAPFVADFFGVPRATDMLRVIGLTPLVAGLRNPGVVYFQKDLNFHKQFVYRISGEVVQFGVAVAYALVWPTAWAFVVAYVASDLFRSLLSYAIHGYRPWPVFDRDAARELIDYGKWITGTSILFFLYSEGDDAVVGWLLAPAALAFYQYAYRFSNAPATELSQVVSKVMFPAFSKLQDDPALLRDAYLKTVRMTSFVAFPAAFGIAAVAPSFVPAFFGPDWTPMITAVQILAAYGLLRAIGKTFGPVWKAIGRPDYVTKLSLLRVALIAVVIYPATTRLGIEGTALTVTAIYLFPMMPLDLYLIARSVDTSVSRILTEFSYPLAASAVMAACVYATQLWLELSPLLEFVLLVPLGALVYVVAVSVLELQFGWGISNSLRTVVSNVRG